MEERLEAQVRERTAQVRELVTQLTMSEQEERAVFPESYMTTCSSDCSALCSSSPPCASPWTPAKLPRPGRL